MSSESAQNVRHRFVDSAGVQLAVHEQGDPANPTILLVHGYPDNSRVWDGVVGALASGGARWHVVSYDVRGMGQSTGPEQQSDFGVEHLAADLAAVVRAVSPDTPVHLVGHDWGSVQAWEAVSDPRYQYLFASFTSMSGPCLDHVPPWWRRQKRSLIGMLKLLSQGARSTYIRMFQLPRLPELFWRNRWVRRWFRAELNDAVRGLELYRANMGGRKPQPRRTSVPVQQVVLTKDSYVRPALVASADEWCAQLWRRPLAARHWAVRSRPETVARHIAEFASFIEAPESDSPGFQHWEQVRVS